MIDNSVNMLSFMLYFSMEKYVSYHIVDLKRVSCHKTMWESTMHCTSGFHESGSARLPSAVSATN